MRRQALPSSQIVTWNFYMGAPFAAHGGACDSSSNSPRHASREPIRSLEAAAKVIRRHAGGQRDRRAEHVLHQIKSAGTLEEAEAAGNAFRAWAEAARPAAGPAGGWQTRLGS